MKTTITLLAALAGLAACASPAEDSSPVEATGEEALTSGSTISFGKAGAPTRDVALKAGSTVTVSYDAQRLLAAHPDCITRSGPEHTQFGPIQMGFKLNGDPNRVYAFDNASFFSQSALHPRATNEIAVPADVTKLDLWFSCAGANGSTIYDNLGGANYVFPVAGPGPSARSRTVITTRHNAIDARVESGGRVEEGGRFTDAEKITIAYDSLDGFGADFGEIHAFVGVRTHRNVHGSGALDFKTTGNTVTLVRNGRRFVGTLSISLPGFFGDSSSQLDGIDVAVSNDQGSWDSNDSRNYRLDF